MDTTNGRSPLVPTHRLARPSSGRRLVAALVGLSLPLLTACSSGADAPRVTEGDATPGSTATATTFPSAQAPGPTVAANGDPLCDLAVAAQSQAATLESTTAELQGLMTTIASGTAPVSDLNSWGSTMYDLADSSTGFYDDAAPYVAGTEAESDFVAMKGFVTTYSMPLAALARDASDSQAFLEAMGTFVQTPEVQSAMTTAPATAQRVASYIAGRCPSTS